MFGSENRVKLSRAFKDIAKVSFATLNSRALGLVRDAATMAYLSIGAVSAAYTFAFTLPNLFRRLLGEGALTSAMVPIFTQSLNDGGEKNAFSFLNKVITRAGIALLLITLAGILISAAALPFASEHGERFFLGAQYSIILLPYLLLICLAAVFSGALNVMGSFGVPSVGPMLLNISIICGLFFGVAVFGAADAVALGYCMCVGWLAGGMMQLGLPAFWLYKKGWRYSFDMSKSDTLGELYALFVPALIGAAVIQVNVFVSKILALFLNDEALPALYLSSRILEFPLGVFAVAIATVYFPKLAMMNSAQDCAGFKREYANGLLISMCISIPAMFGLAILAGDIMTLLFEWGMFNASDVSICTPILVVSVLGLPSFTLAAYATRGFHSKKDTKTPVIVSYWSFGANIAFSLLLMFKFGAAGLAAANVLAATLQAAMLNSRLKKIFGTFGVGGEIVKIIVAAVAMGCVVYAGKWALSFWFEGKALAFITCGAVIPVATAAYILFLKTLKFEQLRVLNNIIFRRIRK